MLIDIDAIVPWDLTLNIKGKPVATCLPSWKGVLQLETVQTQLKSQKPSEEFEQLLRDAIKFFIPEPSHVVLDSLQWGDLRTIFEIAGAYFGEYIKKKSDAAKAAATMTPLTNTESGK